MSDEVKATWSEWSIHVLKELERLNEHYETMNNRLMQIEQQQMLLKNTYADTNEMRNFIAASLAPLTTQLTLMNEDRLKIKQTVYGVNDSSGLIDTVEELTKKVANLTTLKKQIIAVFSVIQILIFIFGDFIMSYIKGK